MSASVDCSILLGGLKTYPNVVDVPADGVIKAVPRTLGYERKANTEK